MYFAVACQRNLQILHVVFPDPPFKVNPFKHNTAKLMAARLCCFCTFTV